MHKVWKKFLLIALFSAASLLMVDTARRAQGFDLTDCSGTNGVQNPNCHWLLAKMEGTLYTGTQTLSGSWSYRYDEWGQPIYTAMKATNGVPLSTGFSIFQAKDKQFFNELFDAPDPNKQGGFLKTSMELVLYYPDGTGTPEAGKVHYKIGFILDLQNPLPNGQPHLMVGYEEHDYPTANEAKVERYLISVNPSPTLLAEVWEYWDLDSDGKVTKIVKSEERLGTLYRIDEFTFGYLGAGTSQPGRLASIVQAWSECALNSTHCGTNATTHKPELPYGNAQHRIITDTTISSSSSEGLVGLKIKEDHGNPPGTYADTKSDKEVTCTISHLQNNKIPIVNLPQPLRDLGFGINEVPTAMNCQTTLPVGSPETYDLTFTWAPQWRFSP